MGFDEVKRIMHQLVWAGLRNRYTNVLVMTEECSAGI